MSSNSRVTNSNQRVTSSNSQLTSSTLRVMSSNQRVTSSNLRVQESLIYESCTGFSSKYGIILKYRVYLRFYLSKIKSVLANFVSQKYF